MLLLVARSSPGVWLITGPGPEQSAAAGSGVRAEYFFQLTRLTGANHGALFARAPRRVTSIVPPWQLQCQYRAAPESIVYSDGRTEKRERDEDVGSVQQKKEGRIKHAWLEEARHDEWREVNAWAKRRKTAGANKAATKPEKKRRRENLALQNSSPAPTVALFAVVAGSAGAAHGCGTRKSLGVVVFFSAAASGEPFERYITHTYARRRAFLRLRIQKNAYKTLFFETEHRAETAPSCGSASLRLLAAGSFSESFPRLTLRLVSRLNSSRLHLVEETDTLPLGSRLARKATVFVSFLFLFLFQTFSANKTANKTIGGNRFYLMLILWKSIIICTSPQLSCVFIVNNCGLSCVWVCVFQVFRSNLLSVRTNFSIETFSSPYFRMQVCHRFEQNVEIYNKQLDVAWITNFSFFFVFNQAYQTTVAGIKPVDS